jgi:hypothetical protein
VHSEGGSTEQDLKAFFPKKFKRTQTRSFSHLLPFDFRFCVPFSAAKRLKTCLGRGLLTFLEKQAARNLRLLTYARCRVHCGDISHPYYKLITSRWNREHIISQAQRTTNTRVCNSVSSRDVGTFTTLQLALKAAQALFPDPTPRSERTQSVNTH